MSSPHEQEPREPVENSLIIKNEQIESAAHQPYLLTMGFSPQLPERLMGLNTTLTRFRPGIRSVGVEMIPGDTPVLTTSLRHSREGYRVNLGAEYRKAFLRISTHESFGLPGYALTLVDIQDYMRDTFPGEEIRLGANNREYARTDVFDDDLYVVTHDVVNEWIKVQEKNVYKFPEAEVMIPHQKDPFLTFKPWTRWNYGAKTDADKIITFHLYGLFYEGTPQEVEEMMEKAIPLFNKPSGYPYRDVDMLDK